MGGVAVGALLNPSDACFMGKVGSAGAIISADKCALFEPESPSSKKFLEVVTPRLEATEGHRTREPTARTHLDDSYGEDNTPPFELEMLEGALMVATGEDSAPPPPSPRGRRGPPADQLHPCAPQPA